MKRTPPYLASIGAVAFFGLAGPLVGMLAFSLVVASSAHENLAFPFRELPGAYRELGLPALGAGVLFVIVVSLWAHARRGPHTRLVMCATGGLSMLLVFSLPYLHGLVLHGYLRPVGILISLLALGVGLVLGGAIPRVLVPSFRRGQHGV